MRCTLSIVLLFIVFAVVFDCALSQPYGYGDIESGNMNNRLSAYFHPYQKKWSRLEPSIRFFKRSGDTSFDQ